MHLPFHFIASILPFVSCSLLSSFSKIFPFILISCMLFCKLTSTILKLLWHKTELNESSISLIKTGRLKVYYRTNVFIILGAFAATPPIGIKLIVEVEVNIRICDDKGQGWIFMIGLSVASVHHFWFSCQTIIVQSSEPDIKNWW